MSARGERISGLFHQIRKLHNMVDLLSPLAEHLLPLCRGYDYWRLPLAGRTVKLKAEDWPEQYRHKVKMIVGFDIEWV